MVLLDKDQMNLFNFLPYPSIDTDMIFENDKKLYENPNIMMKMGLD
jgi:hypothetical protein